jgi:hypothetical protein
MCRCATEILCYTLRVSLHPEGLARRNRNFGEYSAHLVHRIDRQAVIAADPALMELADELSRSSPQTSRPLRLCGPPGADASARAHSAHPC